MRDLSLTARSSGTSSNVSLPAHRDVVCDFLGDGILNADEERRGNIRVFCRCRPSNDEEISVGASSVEEFDTARENKLSICVNGSSKKVSIMFQDLLKHKYTP